MFCLAVVGNVVKEFKIGNTKVRICDDYCRNRTKAEIEEILRRIAKNALGPLTNTAAGKSV